MSKNKINDLRDHLFGTLEALRDPDKPVELERAREVANVARVIVDSAKAEVEFMKATGNVHGTGFIPLAAGTPPDAAPGGLLPSGSAVPIHVCPKCHRQTRYDPCEFCNVPWKRIA